MSRESRAVKRETGSALSRIAVWQFLAFILLLCLIWGSEVLDLPAFFFNASHARMNLVRACTLTAAVILCAIIAVGNTYVQQKRILKGMLILCSSCNKVKISKGAWESLGQYLEKNTLAKLSQELCPDCFHVMEQEIGSANLERWRSGAKRADQQCEL